MSGGSWDYVCYKIGEAADELVNAKDPLRRALGKKMKPFAQAMHDIEWVDSCDYGTGDDIQAIRDALGEDCDKLVMAELNDESKALIDLMKKYGSVGEEE